MKIRFNDLFIINGDEFHISDEKEKELIKIDLYGNFIEGMEQYQSNATKFDHCTEHTDNRLT